VLPSTSKAEGREATRSQRLKIPPERGGKSSIERLCWITDAFKVLCGKVLFLVRIVLSPSATAPMFWSVLGTPCVSDGRCSRSPASVSLIRCASLMCAVNLSGLGSPFLPTRSHPATGQGYSWRFGKWVNTCRLKSSLRANDTSCQSSCRQPGCGQIQGLLGTWWSAADHLCQPG
jgi:hypothetical protein